MKLTKVLALLLTLATLISLVACGAQTSPEDLEKIRKYEKYETIINFLEEKDYTSALGEMIKMSQNDAENDTETGGNNDEDPADDSEATTQTETVELTLDNWKEFFELQVFPRYTYNDFGDVERLILPQYLVFKPEYAERVVSCDDVVIEIKRFIEEIYITVDPTGPSYSLDEVKRKFETTPSPDIISMDFNRNDGYYYIDVFSNNYIDVKNNNDPDSIFAKTVLLVNSLDDIKATRIKGTITFKK